MILFLILHLCVLILLLFLRILLFLMLFCSASSTVGPQITIAVVSNSVFHHVMNSFTVHVYPSDGLVNLERGTKNSTCI